MQLIREGMSWGQTINIINNLIMDVDSIKKALGNTIIDGQIDYNTLANLPKINGKIITGEETTQSLGISIDNETVSQLRQAAETIARQTTTGLLENKASANLDNLQYADANVDDICFFINDKNGVPKKINMETLMNCIYNKIEKKPEIIINNGSFKSLKKSVSRIAESLSEFKTITTNNFSKTNNKFNNYCTTDILTKAISDKATEINNNIYTTYATKTDLNNVDGKFASYAKTTALADYAKTSALDSYVTKTSLSTTLGDYAKTTVLADYAKTTALADYAKTTALDSYVTKTSLSTTLGDYAKTSALAGYATTTALNNVDAKFANYAKTTALDSYVTKTSLSTTLGDYAKTTALADYAKTSALDSYVTKTSLSTTLGDYAKTSALASYATTTALNNVDAKFANYAKTTALDSYVTKTSLSTTLGDYAKTSALSSYLTTSAAASTYAKTSALDSYVTKTSLSTTLGDYAKTSALSSYLTTSAAASTYAKTSALSNYLTTASASSTYATKTALATVESTANTAKNTANSLVTAKIAIETLSSAKWSLDDSRRTYKKYSTTSDIDLQISSNTETGIEHYLLISNTSTKKINISLASAKSIYAETKSIELEAGSLIELSAINISNVITVTASSKLIN